MNRSLLAAPVCALALIGVLTGSALAQEPPVTGPDTEACTEATQALTPLQAQIEAFVAGPPGTLSLGELEAAVQAAIDADNEANAAGDSPATVAAKEALAARKALIATVQAQLDKAVAAKDAACAEPAPPMTEPTTPAAPPTTSPVVVPPLYADCDAVVAAGAAPILPGQPGYRAELDADGDGIGCEVPSEVQSPPLRPDAVSDTDVADQVPSGSVATGGW